VARLLPLTLWLICAAASPASAHHSFAAYIRTNSRTVDATVKEFRWSNPHVELIVVVTGSGGAPEEWAFEGGSINRLAISGFSRGLLKPGDKIAVSYNPKRNGGPGGFFYAVKFPNGRTIGANRNRGPTRGGAEEG
jgi:hypothetical protein